MSDSSSSSSERPKFTRGEKCIFTHIVVTFSLLLLLVIIYFLHLCVVKHSLRDVLKMTRRTGTQLDSVPDVSGLPIGLVYLNDTPVRPLCNSLLLKDSWSVAPGHCVAMRTDPDLHEYLYLWRIKYKSGDQFLVPRNIEINDDTLHSHSSRLFLVGWPLSDKYPEGESDKGIKTYKVDPIYNAQCIRFMEPILELRSYEYCVLLQQKNEEIYPEHGSVFVMDSKIVGLFGWGEKTGIGAPCIILDLVHFKDWIVNIIAW